MAFSADKECAVAPGSTLRRYLDVASYYMSNPNINLDNPPPFMRAHGILPVKQLHPSLTSYSQLDDPEYTSFERKQFERKRSQSSEWIQSNIDYLTLERAKNILPRMDEMMDFLGIRASNERSNADALENGNQTHEEKSQYELIRTGTELHLIDVIRRIKTHYSHPRQDERDETFDFLKYFMGSGLLIPIGNQSFIDAFGKSEKQISGTESLELLVLPFLLGYTGLDVTYSPDNAPKFSKQFPSETRLGINDLILSLAFGLDQVLSKTWKVIPKNRNDRLLGQVINRFVGDLDRKQEIIKKTIFNHTRPDHLDTVDLFNRILSMPNSLIDIFLSMGGINYPADELAFYRKLAACGELNDSAICSNTAAKFEQIAVDNPGLIRSLTLDEMQSYYENKAESEEDQPVLMSDLKQVTAGLRFEKKSNRTYDLDPLLVEDDGFIAPNLLRLTFNTNDSGIFQVRFVYKDFESSDDEKKYLDVDINVNKQSFDWSVLTSPDTNAPGVVALKKSLISLSYKLLHAVKPLTRQLIKSEDTKTVINEPRVKRERNDDIVYKLRSEARKGIPTEPQSPTYIQPGLESNDASKRRIGIQMPDDETWHSLISHFSPRNAAVIMKKINEYNISGTGDIKNIVSEELRDKFDARLRVNIFKDKARVMLKKCRDEKGNVSYKIVDIRRRGEAYR